MEQKISYFSQRGIGDLLNSINFQRIGEIRWVKKTTDTDYKEFLMSRKRGYVYNTIQAALTACVAGEGDIVAVAPGTYTEALTMASADVTLIGLGATPYATKIDGDGSVGITVTGVDVKIENVYITTSGAAVSCIYGTGLVGAPLIQNCYFEQTELTSVAAINIAGATSRGLTVRDCSFYGGSANADAVNSAGKLDTCYNCNSEGFNTTEATAFEGNQQNCVAN